jgi:hypothetical protein
LRDETSAGGVIIFAAFESPAIIAGLNNVAVMDQPGRDTPPYRQAHAARMSAAL